MDRVETTILRNLIYDEEYIRKVIPFIQPDYFDNSQEKVIFEEIAKFIVKYDKPASQEVLSIEIENRSDINDTQFKEIVEIVSSLDRQVVNFEWLVDTTEKWCKDRAIFLGIMKSIGIIDGKEQELDKGAIPDILQKDLS